MADPTPPAVVDSSLPQNWAKTANATPVDANALTTALARATIVAALATDHYVIELDKDTIYSGNFGIDNGPHTERQNITITGSPTGGTFTLSFDGQGPTAGIPYNATAAQVQTELEALSNIDPGDVTCKNGPLPDSSVSVFFTGALDATDVAEMTTSGAGLTGGTAPDSSVATAITGDAGYSGTNWIIIRSSDWNVTPTVPQRTRVTSNVGMATIEQTGTTACMRLEFSAHHVRFMGIEFTTSAAIVVFNLVGFNSGNGTARISEHLCNNVGYDRCWIHSTSDSNKARTGIQVSCDNFFCIDSRIENIKDGPDAQCILFREGVGLKVHNCFLEATGENIMCGGNDNQSENSLAEDLTVSNCYFWKRNEWDLRHADYVAHGWTIKNIFELKMAKRVHMHSCILEHNWVNGQSGYAVVVTTRNQSGGNDWAEVSDFLFENNLLFRTARFCNILPTDDGQTSQQASRYKFRNNLIYTVGGQASDTEDFGASGNMFNFGEGIGDLPLQDCIVENNTFVMQEGELGNNFIAMNSSAHSYVDNLQLLNNVWDDANFSWKSKVDGGQITDMTVEDNGIFFNAAANNYAFRINQTNFDAEFNFGVSGDHLGSGNVKEDTIAAVLFTDNANQDYTLQSGSSFLGMGVNFDELNAAIANSEFGDPRSPNKLVLMKNRKITYDYTPLS